jgi:hypothetical protein
LQKLRASKAADKAEITPYGVVSSAGLGDGYYDCRYYRDSNGNAVKVAIDFGLLDKND